MEPLAMKRWLTPQQAADYLGRPSVNAVRHLMKSGRLPDWTWTRKSGLIRFSRPALDEWLQEDLDRKRALPHNRRGLTRLAG